MAQLLFEVLKLKITGAKTLFGEAKYSMIKLRKNAEMSLREMLLSHFFLYQAVHIIPFPNAHLTFFVNQLASIFTEIERYFHLILRQTYDFIDFKKKPDIFV